MGIFPSIGFGVGFLFGMKGMGGTPLWILLFGIRSATEVATDLLFAAATKSIHGLATRIIGASSVRRGMCLSESAAGIAL
jgi:uncharacterized membrane protein YfcA